MKKLLFILCLGAATRTGACTCEMVSPVTWYLKKVDLIFVGRVIAVNTIISKDNPRRTAANNLFSEDRGYTAKVLVTQQLKGKSSVSDTLHFASEYSSCDPIYTLGESYLFFANKVKNKMYIMAHCTPWGTVDDSRKNIEALKKKRRE